VTDTSTPPPIPVAIANPAPIPVTLTPDSRAKVDPSTRVQRQSEDPSLPANTTFEQNLSTAGQRRINVMWESTQQQTAIIVTAATMLACGFLIWKGDPALAIPAFLFLSNICTQVLTTYFQRTNHTKTGGVAAGDSGR
jgi:hypothetical protein